MAGTTKLEQLDVQGLIIVGQYRQGKKGSVDRPCFTDGKGGHRRASGHLHDGIQRTVVLAASIPGRWAAPPAPAMMARKPICAADSAKEKSSSGMRCAESTWVWAITENASSVSTALLIVGQSLCEPITTAMSVFDFGVGLVTLGTRQS